MIAFLLFSSCFEVSAPAAVNRISGIMQVLLSTAMERSLPRSQRPEHHSLPINLVEGITLTCASRRPTSTWADGAEANHGEIGVLS